MMRLAVEICCPQSDDRFTIKDFNAKMNEKFQQIKAANPLGFMDEFESRIEILAMDIAQEVGADFDCVQLKDKIVFLYDLTGLKVLSAHRQKLLAEDN